MTVDDRHTQFLDAIKRKIRKTNEVAIWYLSDGTRPISSPQQLNPRTKFVTGTLYIHRIGAVIGQPTNVQVWMYREAAHGSEWQSIDDPWEEKHPTLAHLGLTIAKNGEPSWVVANTARRAKDAPPIWLDT